MTPLNFEIEGKPDKVILIYSPCRSGSTAILNSLSMTDMQGFYQPMKAAVRRVNAGNNEAVVIRAETPSIVIKETLGPYFRAEVDYDPISTLIEKGINPSAICVVALFRRPEDCMRSWIKNFRANDIDWSLFNASYEAVHDDCITAQHMGVQVIPVRYEDLANPQTFPAIVDKLGVAFDPAMTDWTLSRKHKSGEFAFDYVPQINNDDNCFNGIAQSNSLTIKGAGIASLPAEIVARAGGLRSAYSIYNSISGGEFKDAPDKSFGPNREGVAPFYIPDAPLKRATAG